MDRFKVNNKSSQLIVLQRIEIAGFFLKKLRKVLGRYFFTNFISRFFLSKSNVGKRYFEIMSKEFIMISKEIESPEYRNFLSIGSGLGGLEVLINQKIGPKKFFFIERNFTSKKVIYGWGGTTNSEAYNNILEQKNFLLENNIDIKNINIFDYDKDKDQFPKLKFDVIISLLSMDYHYDFSLYEKYLKNVSTENTKIIFDTVRPDYFKKVFKKIKILDTKNDTVHKPKRLMCSNFI